MADDQLSSPKVAAHDIAVDIPHAAEARTPWDDIKDLAALHPALVLGRGSCPFCLEAESIFAGLGVPCKVMFDLSARPDWRTALEKNTKQKTVPYVFVTGEFVGGCDDTKALEKSGELRKRLQAAKAFPRDGAHSGAVSGGVHIPYASCDAPVVHRPLFYFPDLVDSWATRLTAGFVSAIAIVTIPLRNNTGIHYVTLGLLIDFCLRLVFGPGPSPLAGLARLIMGIVRYDRPPHLVQGFPKQFATFVGVCCATLGTVFYFIDLKGTRIFAAVIMAMLAFFAALECLLDFCAGCWAFGLAVQLGLLPRNLYTVGVSMKPEVNYCWHYANEHKRLHTPEQGRFSYGGSPTKIDLKYKLQDQEEHERFDWSPLRHAKVTHFNVCLGLMALAALWKYASLDAFGYGITTRVYEVVLGFAVVMYVTFTALYAVKAALYPSKVRKEWQCHVRGNAFAMWPITMVLLAFCIADLWDGGYTWGKVLFWIGAPLQLGLGFMRVSNLVSERMDQDSINAGLLMAPVGGFVASIVGPYLDAEHYTEACYLWFGFAVVTYLPLFTITLHQAMTGHNSDDRLRPLMWTWVAAPAAAALAWAALQAGAGGGRCGSACAGRVWEGAVLHGARSLFHLCVVAGQGLLGTVQV